MQNIGPIRKDPDPVIPGPALDAYRRSAAAQIVQIAVAWLGGWLFTQVGIPASWLSGAVVAVILWGRLGLAVIMPRPLAETAMLVSGVVMGAGMSPETLAAAGKYPLSLLLLAIAVVGTTLASAEALVRLFRWRRDDALLATVPGALTAVMAIAAERKADLVGIGIVQSVRLLLLIIALPFLVSLASEGGGGGTGFGGPGADIAGPGALAALLALGIALGLGFERLGLAAPLLLGATLASGLAHVTGAIPGEPPEAIAQLGFVLIGVFIAQRFNGLSLATMGTLLPAALTAFVVGTSVSAACAGAAVLLAGAPAAEALVAFAPGGLEAMVVLALVMGLDPLYVAVHHLARFLGIGFALPVLYRKRPGARGTPPDEGP